MASSLHKYSVVEAQNAALGQAGAIFESSTTAISGKKIVAIQFLEDSTFDDSSSGATGLIPASSDFIGTANGNGDDIAETDTFPQGMTIFGQWTGFELATGTVIAYLGSF